HPPPSTLFPYTTLFRSALARRIDRDDRPGAGADGVNPRPPRDAHTEIAMPRKNFDRRLTRQLDCERAADFRVQFFEMLPQPWDQDRKSTRLNSSHSQIS